jgi:hypothetical protein
MAKQSFLWCSLLFVLFSCQKQTDGIKNLTFAEDDYYVVETDSVTLTPEYVSVESETPSFVWSSSSPSVATVDNNGKVKGLVTGSTTITVQLASDASVKATCTLTVIHGGTQQNPYLIYDVGDLEAMRDSVNKKNSVYGSRVYKLMADIDFVGDTSWVPIGNKYIAPFSGVFDGNGKTIRNICIGSAGSAAAPDYAGLFGYVNGGTVKDLTVNWTVFNANSVSGGIAAVALNAVVSNCSTTGDISGSDYAGGITGSGSGTISACHAAGNVTAVNYAGGITGSVDGSVYNCYATGNVTGKIYAGGVAGGGGGCFVNCYAAGNVTGAAYAGGVIAYVTISGVTVANCYATGGVSGGTYSGGIIGAGFYSGNISNCYASGNISGGGYAGGIAGYLGLGGVTYCLALSGSVASSGAVVTRVAGLESVAAAGNNYAASTMVVSNASGTVTDFSDGKANGTILTGNAADRLNAFVSANSAVNGISLKGWTVRSGINNGYPVFQ